MKRFLGPAILLLLAMVGVLSVIPGHAQARCDLASCELRIARTIQTNDWGTTFVNDTVTISTANPVTYIDLGVPSQISEKLAFVGAAESNGTSLKAIRVASNQTGGYVPIRVELPGQTGSYSISLRTVFENLLTFNATSKQYGFTFSPFPVVDGTVRVAAASFTVKTGDWSDITSSGIHGSAQGKTFNATTTNLKPYNTTLGRLTFTSGSQDFLEVRAAREITISSAGTILTTDLYNITNKGRDVPSLTFLLPKGTNSIDGSDIVGPLDTAKIILAGQTNGTNLVTFVPRFGTIKNEGGANLKLQYQLASSNYLTSGSLGRYSLSLRMLDDVKFVQQSLKVKISIPTGFKLESVTGQAAVITGDSLVLERSQVNPLTDLSFTISYRLDPFWSSLTPLAWAALLEAGLAAAVLVHLSGAVKTAATGPAPPGLLNRFVEFSDEKAALRLEAEKLEDDLARGAVNRHDFRRRRRTIDLRMNEIDRQLGPVRQELGRLSIRYADLVKRIERAEAELQVVRGSISDLRNQYRGGRMARELYESMNSDLSRRKERTQQAIDNVVIGLREEAR